MTNGFCFKVLQVARPKPPQKRGYQGLGGPSPVKRNIADRKLACPQYLMLSLCLVSTFYLRFEPAATCLFLRSSVSYTKIKL